MAVLTSYLGLGANLGAAAATLASAARQLGAWPQLHAFAVSSLVRGPYVGAGGAQPEYWNAVVRIESEMEAEVIFRRGVELQYRYDSAPRAQNAPRHLDVDLLLHGDLCSDTENLHLPHPRLRARRFVLEPLFELSPQLRLPVDGQSVRELLHCEAIQQQELQVVARGAWWKRGAVLCAS